MTKLKAYKQKCEKFDPTEKIFLWIENSKKNCSFKIEYLAPILTSKYGLPKIPMGLARLLFELNPSNFQNHPNFLKCFDENFRAFGKIC